MRWLLDTNVAIHLRDGDAVTSAKIADLDGSPVLSIVTRIELEGGVYQVPHDASRRRARLDTMFELIEILDLDAASADAYRAIIEALGFSRRKVLDRMIAAHALARDIPLITRNGDDFRDIPGLKLAEW